MRDRIGVVVAMLAVGCSGKPQDAELVGGSQAASACGATQIKLSRYDRRVEPGARFTFDVAVTSSSCNEVPVTFRALAPAFEDDHAHGDDLTALWSPTPAEWERIGRAGSATIWRVRSATAPPRTGLFEIELDVGPAHFHELFTDVTCSDGIYCDGEERLVNGECAEDVRLPCGQSEGDDCLRYECLEATRSCGQTPVGGDDCIQCTASHCTPHCKNNWDCGSDGCGGGCGEHGLACPEIGGEQSYCIEGRCRVVDPPVGTCLNPAPLLGATGLVVPAGGTTTVVEGDSSTNDLELVRPECQAGDVGEYVYRFTLENTQGFEIRMISADDDNLALDTLLAIQPDCFSRLSFPTGTCSDDATPPGGLASRIFGTLPPGSYVVIATGYSASQVGPFKLYVRFNGKQCTPTCDGKDCGNDGCDGPCSVTTPECTEVGEQCNETGQCAPDACEADCSGRQCGPSANNCNPNGDETCGPACGKGKICDLAQGKCVPQKACDPFLPECDSARRPENGVAAYCGTDCEWHRADDPLLDLVPNDAARVLSSVVYQKRLFSDTSCARIEGCIRGGGLRTLMRFDTEVYNVGDAGFDAPSPQQRPDLFEHSACHGHYHFHGFARFDLYYPAGTPAVRGGKLAYCMEDTVAYQSGPAVACDAASTCDDQGIQKGWTDLYARDLDCQWLDITGIEGNRWYCYEVCTNYGRNFQEYSFDNNCSRFPIWVPAESSITEGADLLYGSLSPKGAPPSCDF
jgi:hypothetical protein